MTNALVFEFPLPENLGNARLHWRRKNANKTAYWGVLDALVTTKRLPEPPSSPWVRAVAEIQMRTWRRMDHDGAHSRLKWVLDFLQTRGYIVNDRDLTYQLDARTAPRDDLGITLVLREAA